MKTPKNVYVRTLADGRLSFGEYFNVRWRNVCDPFKIEDRIAAQNLKWAIVDFSKRTGSTIEFVSKDGTSLEPIRALLSSL